MRGALATLAILAACLPAGAEAAPASAVEPERGPVADFIPRGRSSGGSDGLRQRRPGTTARKAWKRARRGGR